MARVLKLSVYIGVVFILYFWIASVATSCSNASESDELIDATEQIDSKDEWEDEFFGEDEVLDEMGSSEETYDNEPTDQPTTYEEVDEILSEDSKKDETSTPAKTIKKAPVKTIPTTSTKSVGGNYLVLAGSFLIQDNANQMVRKLKKMGYDKAEVVVFDMSQYYSVCAGRYQTLSSAQQASGTLKKSGVDNYVHTKQ